MPLHPTWTEILLRLALAALAGILFGWERGETGKPAGLRTTLLVCLAAALAMIQANLLNDTLGKTPDSFAVMDTMRLPLGILSGMGFIGGGAILRRGTMIAGVTTAATLWFVTVIGLCFGGGQLALGAAGLAIGLFVITVLKHVEQRTRRRKSARLHLETSADLPLEDELRSLLHTHGYTISSSRIHYTAHPAARHYACELHFLAPDDEPFTPAFIQQLASRPEISKITWQS